MNDFFDRLGILGTGIFFLGLVLVCWRVNRPAYIFRGKKPYKYTFMDYLAIFSMLGGLVIGPAVWVIYQILVWLIGG